MQDLFSIIKNITFLKQSEELRSSTANYWEQVSSSSKVVYKKPN